MFRRFVAALVLSSCLAPAPTAAQGTGANDRAWSQVQRIAPGAELQVHVDKGDSVRGLFVSASDMALEIYVAKRSFTIDRGTIRKIYSVSHRSRSHAALVGAGIGLGVGVGVGFVKIGAQRSADANLAPLSFGFVGTLAGAAFGALSGGKRRGGLLYTR